MALKIEIKTIPHGDQRYPTPGDYWQDELFTRFRISDLNDPDYELAIAIHELIEHHLIQKRGISIESIDNFDKLFEEKRIPADTREPGDDPIAPYYREHQIATAIERIFLTFCGRDWNDYSTHVDSL